MQSRLDTEPPPPRELRFLVLVLRTSEPFYTTVARPRTSIVSQEATMGHPVSNDRAEARAGMQRLFATFINTSSGYESLCLQTGVLLYAMRTLSSHPLVMKTTTVLFQSSASAFRASGYRCHRLGSRSTCWRLARSSPSVYGHYHDWRAHKKVRQFRCQTS